MFTTAQRSQRPLTAADKAKQKEKLDALENEAKKVSLSECLKYFLCSAISCCNNHHEFATPSDIDTDSDEERPYHPLDSHMKKTS